MLSMESIRLGSVSQPQSSACGSVQNLSHI
jgi:hypothetical protein